MSVSVYGVSALTKKTYIRIASTVFPVSLWNICDSDLCLCEWTAEEYEIMREANLLLYC